MECNGLPLLPIPRDPTRREPPAELGVECIDSSMRTLLTRREPLAELGVECIDSSMRTLLTRREPPAER
jgi:hypothetical protein